MYNAFDILKQYANGLLTIREAEAELDKLDIRGSFSRRDFCGYDYRKQEWIVVTWNVLREAA